MPTFEPQPPRHFERQSAALFTAIAAEVSTTGLVPQPWHSIQIELLVGMIEHIRTRREEAETGRATSHAPRGLDEEWMKLAEETADALRISGTTLARLLEGSYLTRTHGCS